MAGSLCGHHPLFLFISCMPPPNLPTPPPSSGKSTVLLIDDHAPFARMLKQFLSRASHLHIGGTAGTAEEGLDLARRLQPDLVLLDLDLPDRFGLDVLPLLKAVDPALRVIILTMHDDATYARLAAQKGADGFVTKRTLTEALLPEIDRVLGLEG